MMIVACWKDHLKIDQKILEEWNIKSNRSDCPLTLDPLIIVKLDFVHTCKDKEAPAEQHTQRVKVATKQS